MKHCYMSHACFCILTALAVCCSLLHAAEAPAKQPTNLEIVRATDALGSRAKRRAAEALLRRAGPAALSVLEETAESPNKAVAARAAKIMDGIRLGISPDTPEAVRTLATAFSNTPDDKLPVLLHKLAAGGPHGLQAIRALTMGQNGRERIFAKAAADWWRSVPGLIRAGKLDEAEAVLWMAALGGRIEATLCLAPMLIITNRAERARDEVVAWHAFHKSPATANTLALLHNANGHGKLAASMAAFKDRDVLTMIHRSNGHWQALMAVYPLSSGPYGGPTKNYYKSLGLYAAISRFSGDETAYSILPILQHGAARDETFAPTIAPILLLNGVTDGVVDMLIKAGSHEQAQAILLTMGKVDAAVKLDQQILRSIAAWRPNSIETQCDIATLHFERGDEEKARQRIKNAATLVSARTEARHVATLAQTERRLGMAAAASAHCLDALARDGKRNREGKLLATALSSTPDESTVWWRFLRDKYAAEAPEETLARLDKLLHRRMTATEFRPLAEEALKAAARITADDKPPAPPRRGRSKPHDRQSQWIAVVAITCARYDANDIALRAFMDCHKRTDDFTFLHRAASIKLNAQQWVDAAEMFGQVAAHSQEAPLEVTSLYTQGYALTRSERAKEGQALMKQARLLETLHHRSLLAPVMDECGAFEAAYEQHRLIARATLSSPLSPRSGLRVQIQRAQERGHWAYARLMAEQMAFAALEANLDDVSRCQFIGNRATVARIADELAAGKKDEARKAAREFAAFAPGDADAMICLVNAFGKAGLKKDADALFAAAFAVRTAVAKAWPNRASALNGVAWIASQCGRKLDQALRAAKKAVAQAPDKHSYMDTLASVHYARKEFAQAVAWEEECLRLNPTSPFTIWQLARFRAALRKTEK